MESLHVAVGTQNKAKLKAVEKVFNSAYGKVAVEGVAAESGISDQPMNDEESIRGAINRADAALGEVPSAEYGVGLEGNVAETAGHMFLRGWVAIKKRSGETGLGHSGGLELPESIRRQILGGKELGPLIQEMLEDKDNEVRHSLGTNGVLSDGLYTREDEFTHAVQCALAKFIKPELY